jgi:hypothetical protein
LKKKKLTAQRNKKKNDKMEGVIAIIFEKMVRELINNLSKLIMVFQ